MEGQRKKNKRVGCWWFLLILLVGALGVVFLVGGTIFVLSQKTAVSLSSGWGEDECPSLREYWAWGHGKTKVVVIPLKGLILLDANDGRFFGAASSTMRAIRRATRDEKVRAIILQIDSGGGGITASDMLCQALQEFRAAQEGRKVIAIFEDVAASGAYYVALAADYILAHPTSITGSLGVLIQSFNIRELGEKIGVKDVTVKSGTNKDILNPFRDLTDEQRQMLQGIVDELHNRFIKLVAERRNLPEDEVRSIADGRIFTASTALERGLVDEIGYWNDAVKRTADLLNVDEVKIYRYEERFSLVSLLRAANPWGPIQSLISDAGRPRLLYLWQPQS